MRQTFEETGMSYDLEVEMVHIAHEMDLFSSPYAFNAKEAVKMAKAGADVIVAHCGCTVGGSIGAESIMELDMAVKIIQEIHDAAKAERSDILILCHGGPISSPEDAAQLSAMSQSIGYLIAAAGPLGMGFIYSIFKNWNLNLLLISLMILILFGITDRCGRDITV